MRHSKEILQKYDEALRLYAEPEGAKAAGEKRLQAFHAARAWHWCSDDDRTYVRNTRGGASDSVIAYEQRKSFERFVKKARKKKFAATNNWSDIQLILAFSHFETLLRDGTADSAALFAKILRAEEGDVVTRTRPLGIETFACC